MRHVELGDGTPGATQYNHFHKLSPSLTLYLLIFDRSRIHDTFHSISVSKSTISVRWLLIV